MIIRHYASAWQSLASPELDSPGDYSLPSLLSLPSPEKAGCLVDVSCSAQFVLFVPFLYAFSLPVLLTVSCPSLRRSLLV